jgi:IMP cyclohydrolase
MTNHNVDVALRNFALLSSNPYPGRGIVAGLDEAGTHLIQIYWIMGRSPNSRNRVFEADEARGWLYTVAADEAKLTDPSLVIYNAMRRKGDDHVVSNGHQTDTVVESQAPLDLQGMLSKHVYEPDDPNFTPRITAMCSLSVLGPSIQMSILRKSMFGDGCDRMHYDLVPHPGFGYCITTYAGDGNPLPPFRGDPLVMPLRGSMGEIADTYWQALDAENRVSLAVKFIDVKNGRSEICIVNKHERVK